MDLNTADIFAWLAFVEALSFEDFKLAMAVRLEDFAFAMAVGASQLSRGRDRTPDEAVVICPGGDSGRLLLLPGPPFSCPADVTETDIVCVCPVAHPRNVAELFRDLVGRGVRTCLVHRSERPHCPAEAAAAVKAERWIEWPTPYSDGRSLSGLVFSDRWRPDASGHAARTIARFMATLAPQAPRSVQPADQQ